MNRSALDKFKTQAQKNWSGLNSDTVLSMKDALVELARTSNNEAWLQKIHQEKPASVELYRDERFGFILLAHTEEKGTYRRPHNHGAGWVFYAVQHGKTEMATYKQMTNTRGQTELVSRGGDMMGAGDCKVFLPGDIHDTKCLSDYLVQFRLTSSDLKKEITEGRMEKFLGHE